MTKRLVLSLALALIGCDPERLPAPGQIVVHVDTDAPLPPRVGTTGDGRTALFDRLRVDVYEGGVLLANLTREFVVDRETFAERGTSFGLLGSSGHHSARVRLFRSDRRTGEDPIEAITLDTTFALPPVPPAGETHVSVVLHVEDVGRRIGEDAPVTPADGPIDRSQVGAWDGAQVVPCSGVPAEDEACVPGGPFLFGNPDFVSDVGFDIESERVTVVSPFFLETHEVTVSQFRRARRESAALSTMPPPATGVDCTWSIDEGPNEDLPINCIDHETARTYCLASGRDLPTEAQLEYAGSGMGAELRYPWGNDQPRCADAAFATATMLSAIVFEEASADCVLDAGRRGAARPGSGLLDRIVTTAGHPPVLDLAGGVAEWALDGASMPTADYWTSSGVRRDPIAPASRPEWVSRGGSFVWGVNRLTVGHRWLWPTSDRRPAIGYRCARPGR